MTSEDRMTETMNIEDYLAQGGVLTSPGNLPARYRDEVMRRMSSFVDSKLAASAGFAASINLAPGIKERIAASRITLEKADHAERVLNVMADFGTDTARHQHQHDGPRGGQGEPVLRRPRGAWLPDRLLRGGPLPRSRARPGAGELRRRLLALPDAGLISATPCRSA